MLTYVSLAQELDLCQQFQISQIEANTMQQKKLCAGQP